jgi:hypothetical protein
MLIVSPRIDIDTGFCSAGRSMNASGRPASPYPLTKKNGNAGTGDVDIENGDVKKNRFCQSPRILDIASLGNNAMPKLFDHVGEHHPDQNVIFDQEYGCLAEHFSGRLWRYRKRFCSSR